mgnify:CR=1 FL=1
MKYFELVHLADVQLEFGGLCGVELYTASQRIMQASEVHSQFCIDEHPGVIVTRQLEQRPNGPVRTRSAAILKPVGELAGEVKIVQFVGDTRVGGAAR